MKEISYQEKIQLLQPLMPTIVAEIKRELKNEHLRKDPAFHQKYFSRKLIEKITVEDLVEGYSKALNEGNEEAGEWIASRWMLKHTDLYQFFAEKLSEINPDFDEIESIDDTVGRQITAAACQEFGANATYIFSVFNSVVFSKVVFEELRQKLALSEKLEDDAFGEVSAADLKKKYEESLSRVVEKYEKKLQSLEKKYVQDMAGYKKQIASLQRQLK